MALPPLAGPDHVCATCAMTYADITAAKATATIRRLPGQYRATLDGLPDAVVRRRPDPQTWSVIEYVCHVRDVDAVFVERIQLALTADDPIYEPLGNDQRAERLHYDRAGVAETLDELEAAARRLADLLDTVDGDDWQRTARRLPGEQRDVLWMARQSAHEGVHHLADIHDVAARIRAGRAAHDAPAERPMTRRPSGP